MCELHLLTMYQHFNPRSIEIKLMWLRFWHDAITRDLKYIFGLPLWNQRHWLSFSRYLMMFFLWWWLRRRWVNYNWFVYHPKLTSFLDIASFVYPSLFIGYQRSILSQSQVIFLHSRGGSVCCRRGNGWLARWRRWSDITKRWWQSRQEDDGTHGGNSFLDCHYVWIKEVFVAMTRS